MDYVVLPKCPVCWNRYSKINKPLVLQPCGHGICETCMAKYRSDEEEVTCPKCREVVIEEKPNFDLLDCIPEEEPDTWCQQLIEFHKKSGVTVHVDKKVHIMAKVLVKRIEHAHEIEKSSTEWTDGERRIIGDMMTDFCDCIISLQMRFTEAMQWIQVMSLPTEFETFFTHKVVKMYENKDFLKTMDAEWLMELIPINI